MSDKTELKQWVVKKAQLRSLKPFEHNPRVISETNFDKLLKAIESEGYRDKITATKDLRVIGGHQRIQAMMQLGYDEVDIIVPDWDITDEQYMLYVLKSNTTSGDWDSERLANFFDNDMLKEAGVAFDLGDGAVFGAIEAENAAPPKNMVRCPHCTEEFPVKGNKVLG